MVQYLFVKVLNGFHKISRNVLGRCETPTSKQINLSLSFTIPNNHPVEADSAEPSARRIS